MDPATGIHLVFGVKRVNYDLSELDFSIREVPFGQTNRHPGLRVSISFYDFFWVFKIHHGVESLYWQELADLSLLV